MASGSAMSRDLIAAYRQTHYRVYGTRGAVDLILHIDQDNAALRDLHRSHNADCSAFITACNPLSRQLSDEENAVRQHALAQLLRERQLTFLDGIGQHPSSDWPGEPSFLVLGLRFADAAVICTQFEQNAFVGIEADGLPQLILLR